ncbi:N-acetylmuramoyl-L-alanine amidase [Streptomyces sp. TRM72054]|uniref:N-acetylmuramoyl-L-alanine amidase n=1 Tax=Streptomyces sp. TRM72054 TaxID=2870562 RepID=UPI0021AB4EC1|nr:N-acetylmuramoyl-L-alanine amidase [Streptomyces sp. TRM72054]
MANPLSASKMVEILRAEGLTVHEVRNWRTHNRNHKGPWGPVNGVMIHHTVTSGTAASVDICYDGYSGLPGPLCHGVIDKQGHVHLVGNGRANHAGSGDPDVLRAVINETALPADNEATADGNRHFYGFECINLGDGKDPWPAAQLLAIEKVSAAICRHHGWSERSVIGHLEWQPGKVDPRGFTMASMRGRIADQLDGSVTLPTPPQEENVELTDDDIRRYFRTDGAVPAARPPVNNADYDTNKGWTAGYALQTAVEGIRKAQQQIGGLPYDTWAYRGKDETRDAYAYLRDTAADVEALKAKVESLQVGGVDLDVLADKVADKLAARLAE